MRKLCLALGITLLGCGTDGPSGPEVLPDLTVPPVPENVDLVIPNDGGCFGCSPSNPRGMHLTFRRVGDEVRVRHAIPDAFHGAPGVAHGGIVPSGSPRTKARADDTE